MLATSYASAYASNDYTQAMEGLVGGPIDWTTSHIGTSHVAGMFTDTYTFSYSGLPGTAAGFFANIATGHGDINFTSATLNGNNLFTFNYGMLSASYFGAVPVSGTLTLVINGSTTGLASYAGTLDVSAVPEPATYGMMLGGLALLGVMTRRRKSS